jgi:hypothetical protein
LISAVCKPDSVTQKPIQEFRSDAFSEFTHPLSITGKAIGLAAIVVQAGVKTYQFAEAVKVAILKRKPC